MPTRRFGPEASSNFREDDHLQCEDGHLSRSAGKLKREDGRSWRDAFYLSFSDGKLRSEDDHPGRIFYGALPQMAISAAQMGILTLQLPCFDVKMAILAAWMESVRAKMTIFAKIIRSFTSDFQAQAW